MILTKELENYSADVVSDKIISCQKHKWSCQRFLDDLNTEDFPYVFIPERAERFLNWMRLFKHRKGVLKGQHIDPHIIQKFIYGNIYGWYEKDSGYRRFNKMYWQVARKNAKSQSMSCSASYELMVFDESGIETQEIYVAATKTKQAQIIWEETHKQLKNAPLLNGLWKTAYSEIIHPKTDGTFRALSEEDGQTGDGFNPQAGYIDELHAHKNYDVYDVIDSGMGAREEPFMGIITTAGKDLSYPCYRTEYKLASDILNPKSPIKLESYFVMINELETNNSPDAIIIDGKKIGPGELIDDMNDESTWEKANPIICSYSQGISYLRKKLKEAKAAPEKMRNFLTKHLDIWVNQRNSGYMNMGKWAACGATEERPFPDVKKKTVFLGLDLSSTIDLTSVAFLIPLENNEYALMGHSFMPEERFTEKRMKTDAVPYALWKEQGWLTVTEGAEVSYQEVFDYVVKVYEKYQWKHGEWCYDRALATWMKQEAERKGFTPVDIAQTFGMLSEPCKRLRSKTYDKKLIHDNNPIITWAVGNAVTRTGPSENIILDKSKSSERIDPVACVINAMARAMTNEKPIRTGKVAFI